MTNKELISRSKIQEIRLGLLARIEELLSKLEIDYRDHYNRLSGTCPVHDGDNETALSIFIDAGNWKCWTHSCEENYGNDLIGFIRGVLSNINGEEVTFKDAVEWSCSFLKIGSTGGDDNYDRMNKKRFSFQSKIFNEDTPEQKSSVTRNQIRNRLEIPSGYYIDRGFCPETLDKFDVGLCVTKNKLMYNRVVVPIYDDSHKYMVGCIGRKVREGKDPKWLFSLNFHKRYYLYNYWYAKKYIEDIQSVVLVEGQGDVWRLEEAGIHNSVGVFGCGISDQQKIKLEKSGALNVVVITDNDKAGIEAKEKIKKQCQRSFNLFFPEIRKKDIGEMSIEEVRSELLPQLDGLVI